MWKVWLGFAVVCVIVFVLGHGRSGTLFPL